MLGLYKTKLNQKPDETGNTGGASGAPEAVQHECLSGRCKRRNTRVFRKMARP